MPVSEDLYNAALYVYNNWFSRLRTVDSSKKIIAEDHNSVADITKKYMETMGQALPVTPRSVKDLVSGQPKPENYVYASDLVNLKVLGKAVMDAIASLYGDPYTTDPEWNSIYFNISSVPEPKFGDWGSGIYGSYAWNIPMKYCMDLTNLILRYPPVGKWPLFLHDVRRTGRADSFNVIYVGSSDHYLYALNPDGTLKWRYLAGNQIWFYGDVVVGLGGTIHFGCDDGYIYALNPDGTLKWRYFAGNAPCGVGVDLSDGTVYAGGGHDNYLYALDRDGNLKWRYLTESWVENAPLVGPDRTVYFGSEDHYIYALNPDGTLKWRYNVGGVTSSPSLSPDGETVYIGSFYGLAGLYALRASDGAFLWSVGRNTVSTPTVADDGTIHILLEGMIRAYNPDGTLKWSYPVGFLATTASPSVDKDGNVYCGSTDNYLYALDKNGNLKWRYLTGDWIFSSPAITPNGLIIFTSEDGYVYALNPDGTLNWRYNIGGWTDVSPSVV